MFSSIFLAKKGYEVIIIEKNTKAGRKILASGNGKCNITNTNLSLEHFNTFSNKSFVNYSLENMSYSMIKTLFEDLGLLFDKGNASKKYPMSMQASSVSEILYDTAIHNGVKFIFNEEVTNITYENNQYELNNQYNCKYLVLANGSKAMQKLGSSQSGYLFAKQFKHSITKLIPSLVQLKSNDKSIYALSGVKINSSVALIVNKKVIKTVNADILFTKYGLSGNSILEISRKAALALNKKEDVYIHIDILPEYSNKKLIELLIKRKYILKNKDISFLLKSIINDKMIKYIYNQANIKYENINNLSKQDISNIVHFIKNIKITINDTNGFENAEVVAGGINLNEVNEKTMESKLQKNLFFCGEILDVDGDCGGYNFHWAWSSAYTLSNNFKSLKKD